MGSILTAHRYTKAELYAALPAIQDIHAVVEPIKGIYVPHLMKSPPNNVSSFFLLPFKVNGSYRETS